MTEAHSRIDKGIKRPRKTAPVPRNVKDERSGRYLAKIPDDIRSKIIEEASLAIQQGEHTHAAMDALGAKYGVSGRTVRTYLLADERAEKARGLLINGELARSLDEMRLADAPIPLARAREEFRAWSWMAERRESRLYGQKQELKVEVNVNLADRLIRARERVIHNAATQLPQRSSGITDAVLVEDGTKGS